MEIRQEIGYKMLDNLNVTQVKTYKDMTELANWLITEKGKEHNIEIVAFDTGDELALITDAETIRQSNVENPTKKCKSIKGAFGGYTAGEKFSANDLIKPYMTRLQEIPKYAGIYTDNLTFDISFETTKYLVFGLLHILNLRLLKKKVVLMRMDICSYLPIWVQIMKLHLVIFLMLLLQV